MNSTDFNLHDFCEMESLFVILKDWAECTGLSAIVLDSEGIPVSKSFGMSPVCALIKSTEEGTLRCKNNWKGKADGVHQCHAGCYDFAIPITLPNGMYVGRVMAGQCFTNDIPLEEIKSRILSIDGMTEEKLEPLLEKLPRKSATEMQSSYNLLKQMIEYFIKTNYANYQEAKARKFDVNMLVTALKTVYRLSMYFNLSKNEYHIIDHDTGVTNIVPIQGSIDEIVKIGVMSIPDKEQAEEYYRLFNRQAMIKAFSEGQKEITFQHKQTAYDGTVHWMQAKAVLVEVKNNEYHAVCLNRIIDNEIESELELQEAYKKTMQQQRMLEEALDNYKQADYDRRRDFLTGLRNRQDMFELLNDTLSGRRSKITSMYMMDIDNFKALNDVHGHSYGDECLKKIGKALELYGKKNDIYFFRYGGEEMLGIGFAVGKPEEQIAQELVKLISDLKITRTDSELGVVTVSLGYTKDNSRFEKMIDKADKAMYQAKENGKNQAVSFEAL